MACRSNGPKVMPPRILFNGSPPFDDILEEPSGCEKLGHVEEHNNPIQGSNGGPSHVHTVNRVHVQEDVDKGPVLRLGLRRKVDPKAELDGNVAGKPFAQGRHVDRASLGSLEELSDKDIDLAAHRRLESLQGMAGEDTSVDIALHSVGFRVHRPQDMRDTAERREAVNV